MTVEQKKQELREFIDGGAEMERFTIQYVEKLAQDLLTTIEALEEISTHHNTITSDSTGVNYSSKNQSSNRAEKALSKIVGEETEEKAEEIFPGTVASLAKLGVKS